tara:strand:+ start:277 stop:543 length:267 start_codon:yes stop_codon:yes gene_type:complete
MKKTIYTLLFMLITLSACATKDLPSSATSTKAKLIMSGEQMMCLSEEEEECLELAKNKCMSKEFMVIREEVEDNTFENDKYLLTFKCN